MVLLVHHRLLQHLKQKELAALATEQAQLVTRLIKALVESTVTDSVGFQSVLEQLGGIGYCPWETERQK